MSLKSTVFPVKPEQTQRGGIDGRERRGEAVRGGALFLPEYYLSFFPLTAAPPTDFSVVLAHSLGMNKSVGHFGRRFNFSNFTHKKVRPVPPRRCIAGNRLVIRAYAAAAPDPEQPEPVSFVKRSDAVIFIWLPLLMPLPAPASFGSNQSRIKVARLSALVASVK